MRPRGLVVSAPSSGAGKTVVTLGLLRALRRRGMAVASAKSGPDYIDPAFHAAATGRACFTLDPWCADADQLRARAGVGDADLLDPAPALQRAAQQRGLHDTKRRVSARTIEAPDQVRGRAMPRDGSRKILIVEGAMGLFDGAPDPSDPLGKGSTADTAAAIGLPVVLVVDAARTGQTAAAVVAGLTGFRDDTHIAGVILNRIGSPRHEAMLRAAVETVRPVLGAIPRANGLSLPSRHLGLVQAGEHEALDLFIDAAAETIEAHCDLDALLAQAESVRPGSTPRRLRPLGQRIAVARDTAFAFAYPHMLADWRAGGADILPFSPLADEGPAPDADAVFLPGGYPELHAGRLAAANGFVAGMRAARERAAVIHGECGGYMVLGRGLVDADGTRHAMLGLLGLETSFAQRRLHLGYRVLTPVVPLGWGDGFRGHEFHYATVLEEEGEPLFALRDAAGADLGHAGLRADTVGGSFAHIVEPA